MMVRNNAMECLCSVPYRYSAHTRMGCPICIWAADTCTGSPYAYGLPRTGSPYTRMGQNSCFAHMRMSAHMRIGMLHHTSIATAMT